MTYRSELQQQHTLDGVTFTLHWYDYRAYDLTRADWTGGRDVPRWEYMRCTRDGAYITRVTAFLMRIRSRGGNTSGCEAELRRCGWLPAWEWLARHGTRSGPVIHSDYAVCAPYHDYPDGDGHDGDVKPYKARRYSLRGKLITERADVPICQELYETGGG